VTETRPPRSTSSPPPTDPTKTWSRPLAVQFIHGLEGSPRSAKATYLDRWFDSETPAMDTSDFEGAITIQAQRLTERPPEVLVGSSFGGAVALALLGRGLYAGSTVLLAPAHRHYYVEEGVEAGVGERIPNGVPVIIVHGKRDDVVSIEGSRALAQTGTPGLVRLVVVDDEHRLGTLVETDALANLVRAAFDLRR
jgi:pimeloyl-ACP methyl ester carboxylesterase